ncbi:MAG TPA: hypothetical protein DEB37_04580 [Lysinibacillus sp.]|jgi:hypothetical protein|uniref:Uncharacterized protein n=2 Tax=Bacillaceae TaxID=186817 RepID=A0A2I0UYY5_9BACI|nr:hypothetical protein AK833_00145 [Lysinibacillus sp. F5]PKU51209.1 hypothetical protein CRI88_10765 [Lysinibacillus fusiformis]HBT71556.1 hypothetical protein [Lysinibacillus sp.]
MSRAMDEEKDYYPEASRYTLAVVLLTLIIWGIYDWRNAHANGFQFLLINEIVITLGITRYMLKKRDQRRKRSQ